MNSHLTRLIHGKSPGRRTSLQGRIVASVGAALLLILIIFVVIALWALRQGTEEAFQGRVTLARIAATHVDRSIEHLADVLLDDERTAGLAPDALSEEQRAELVRLHRRLGPSASLAMVTRNGTIVWSACGDPCYEAFSSALPVDPVRDLLPHSPRFSERASGAVVLARIEVPTVDDADRVTGELIADVDPSHSSLLLVPPSDAEQGIEIALIARSGRFLAGDEPIAPRSIDLSRLAARSHAELIAATEASPRAAYRIHDSSGGQFPAHVVAWAPLSSMPTWVVTVEQPIDRALELPIRVEWYLAIFCGATLAGVMLLALFDARRITAPLRQLTAAAERVSTGSFDVPINVDGTDEVGELGRALSSMQVQLRDLLKRERSVAVLEERERIAGEMHDGLGQVLGYVIMKSLAVAQLIDSGQIPEARAQVDQLGAAAREAYADVRESILALRTTLTPDRDLLAALRAYVAGFERQNEIVVQLTVPDAYEAEWLDPAAEVQLLRIVQEALTNVRKHAQARHVTIQLAIGADRLCLEIADDGRGFDPPPVTANSSSHFGLQIMRERAEGIGGTFEIQSAIGGGTQIVVSLPERQRGGADGPDTHSPGG